MPSSTGRRENISISILHRMEMCWSCGSKIMETPFWNGIYPLFLTAFIGWRALGRSRLGGQVLVWPSRKALSRYTAGASPLAAARRQPHLRHGFRFPASIRRMRLFRKKFILKSSECRPGSPNKAWCRNKEFLLSNDAYSNPM
ncbi:hypothetical protein D3C76_1031070 [compost metagenome]